MFTGFHQRGMTGTNPLFQFLYQYGQSSHHQIVKSATISTRVTVPQVPHNVGLKVVSTGFDLTVGRQIGYSKFVPFFSVEFDLFPENRRKEFILDFSLRCPVLCLEIDVTLSYKELLYAGHIHL